MIKHRRLALVALLLGAVNMRPAVTSLGPVLAEVRAALGMGATVAGLLTSVPVACFAVVGTIAPRLARRFSAATGVAAGLAAAVVGLAARVFTTGTVGFAAATALALAGIALVNVLLPAVVKDRFPDRVGTVTGWYSTALNAGATAAAAVTVPIAGAFGDDWRIGLGTWALLAALSVPPWILLSRDGSRTRATPPTAPGSGPTPQPTDRPAAAPRPDAANPAASRIEAGHARAPHPEAPYTRAPHSEAPHSEAPHSEAPHSEAPHPDAPHRDAPHPDVARPTSASGGGGRPAVGTAPAPTAAGPMARNPVAWALAAYFGLQATSAYVMIGWLPQVFRDAGLSAATAGLLFAVTSLLGVPLSIVLSSLAGRLRNQSGIAVGLALVGLVAYAGLWWAPNGGAWVWAVLFGVANCSFPLALTMIGMRGRDGAAVVRLSAFAQSAGYLLSIPGPVLVGVLYDHTGGWSAPLMFMILIMTAQLVAGYLAGRDREVG